MGYNWRRLGDAIRDGRDVLGETQKALAERAGVSLGALKHLEKGAGYKYWPPTVALVAKALDWPENRAREIAVDAPTAADQSPSLHGALVPDELDPTLIALNRMRISKSLRRDLIAAYQAEKSAVAQRVLREALAAEQDEGNDQESYG